MCRFIVCPNFIFTFFSVTEINNDRVQKFDNNGKFITKWGSPGNGDGQFNTPIGVIVDPSGYVYVVDGDNKRIQVFAPSSNQTLSTSNP